MDFTVEFGTTADKNTAVLWH